MKRQVPGLSQTTRDLHSEVPDGMFLVRLDSAQHRWHAQKPFYVLRLSILEPEHLPAAPSSAASTAPPRRCGSWAGSCGTSSMTLNC